MNSSLKAHPNSRLFPPEALQRAVLELLVVLLAVPRPLLRKRRRRRRKKRRKSQTRTWASASSTKCMA
jgi:hypothetical protein